jgi:hypothetical protein
MIDFNKLEKIRGLHRATLQNYKVTWTSLMTNGKAKSIFTRRLVRLNHPPSWALHLYLLLYLHSWILLDFYFPLPPLEGLLRQVILTTISSQLAVAGFLFPIPKNMSSDVTACLYIISYLKKYKIYTKLYIKYIFNSELCIFFNHTE